MGKKIIKTSSNGGNVPVIGGIAVLYVSVDDRFLNRIPGPGIKGYLDSSDFERIVTVAIAAQAKTFISEEEAEAMRVLPMSQNKTFTEDFTYSGEPGTIRFKITVSSSVAEIVGIRYKLTVEGDIK